MTDPQINQFWKDHPMMTPDDAPKARETCGAWHDAHPDQPCTREPHDPTDGSMHRSGDGPNAFMWHDPDRTNLARPPARYVSDEVVATVDDAVIYCDADNPLGGPACRRPVDHDGTQPTPHDGLHEAVGANGELYRWGTRSRPTSAVLDGLDAKREELLRRIADGFGVPREVLDDPSTNHWTAGVADYEVEPDGHTRAEHAERDLRDAERLPRPGIRRTGEPVTASDVQCVLYDWARKHGAGSQAAYDLAHRLEQQAANPADTPASGVQLTGEEITRGDVQQVIYHYARQLDAPTPSAHGIAQQLEHLAAAGAEQSRTGATRYDTYKLIHQDRDVWPWWQAVLRAVEAHPDGPEADGVTTVEAYDDVVAFVQQVLAEHAADVADEPVTFHRDEVVACLSTWAQQQGASEVWADEVAERFAHLIAGAAAYPDRPAYDLGVLIYNSLEWHLGHGQLTEQVNGALWLLGSGGRLLQRGATHQWGGGGGPEGQTSLVPAAVTTVPPGSPYVVITTRDGHLP
jgi:hypothetical protein